MVKSTGQNFPGAGIPHSHLVPLLPENFMIREIHSFRLNIVPSLLNFAFFVRIITLNPLCELI